MAKDINAIFLGIVIIAIVAVVTASTGTADFIKSAGNLIKGLTAINVSPAPTQRGR